MDRDCFVASLPAMTQLRLSLRATPGRPALARRSGGKQSRRAGLFVGMQDMSTTVIKNAAWVIAWDAPLGRQIYRRGVDLAFSDDRIVFLGRDFAGPADRVIDGSARVVLPGLIDIHSHPEHEPLYRGIREEHGLPSMHMTGLYERSQALSATDDEARAASAEFAYCELLLCGVTSLVDISPPWAGWVELFAKSGMRGFLAPGYRSARWYLKDDHELRYAWDEARGRAGFAAALETIDNALGHPCGRLSGVVSPMQIDTCTEGLLRDSRAAARERGLPFTLHVAQSVSEVREMVRRHGQTPVQWAQGQRLLGPGVSNQVFANLARIMLAARKRPPWEG